MGGISLLGFKTYHYIKTGYWQRDRCTDQWTRIENSEISAYKYPNLFLPKKKKPFNRGKTDFLFFFF